METITNEQIQCIKDRERVNEVTKTNPRPCIPVSIEFFEEMIECIPPKSFTRTDDNGYYSIMQVGEAMNHNKYGQEQYETFQRMSEETPKELQDSRMEPGQWYFTGLRTEYKKV